MSGEVIGAIIGTLVTVGAVVGGIVGAMRNRPERPPSVQLPVGQPESTGRHRVIVEETDISTAILREVYSELASLNRELARDASSRKSIAEIAVTVDALEARAQRGPTRDELRRIVRDEMAVLHRAVDAMRDELGRLRRASHPPGGGRRDT